MNRLLFLIHGMGRHDDAWENGPLAVLKEAAEGYGVADRFEEWVTVEALSYDTVFRDYVGGLGKSVEQLRDLLEQQGTGGTELPGWIEGLTEEEKGFFWTHVIDVVMYRFVPQIFTEVRTRVMRDFVAAVNAATPERAPGPRVAIVAHSLGTSVIHDALAYLTTRPIDGSRAYLSETGWRLDHLFMLANVSRVLSRLATPFYRSSVRCENAPGDVMPALREYLNFRHSLDPIPAVKAFQPAGWGSRFTAAEFDHLLEWNVHGYEHYLRHPDVHVPILNRLLDYPITEEQHWDAVDELEEVGTDACAEVLSRLRLELRQARDLVRSAGDEPVALIKVATHIHALIVQARKDCTRPTP